MRPLTIITLASCIFFTASCDIASRFIKKKPTVVFDANMDLDDMSTLYLLSRNYKDRILCVIPSETPEYNIPNSYQYACDVLQMANRSEIPVSGKSASPFCPGIKISKNWVSLVDSFATKYLPQSSKRPLDVSASELLVTLTQGTKDKLIILCLGPESNIAHILTEHPSVRDKIERIILLGGSLHITEGTTVPSYDKWKESTDYNFFVDPCASNIILTSQIPVTLVPLDITNLIPINPVVLELYGEAPKSEGAKFVMNVLKEAIAVSSENTGITPFWNMVAAASIFDPSIVRLEKISLKVITEPGENFGNVVEAADGTIVDVCTYIDPEKFYMYFFSLINR